MKQLRILLLAALSVLALSGCSKSNGNLDILVGKWDCEKLILDGDDMLLTTAGMTLKVTFNKGGSWTAVTTGMEDFDIPFLGGTFSITDKNLVLKQEGVEYVWNIISLTKSRAEFYWPDQEYVDNELKLVFVR